jgi:hypothetical protein
VLQADPASVKVAIENPAFWFTDTVLVIDPSVFDAVPLPASQFHAT